MFFDDDEDVPYISPQEFLVFGSQKPSGHGKNIPTHTEDGIPIRKVYVTNLPPKTTRAELYEVFTQYGQINSCWVKMQDNEATTNLSNKPNGTFAFITYKNPSDAHNALQAPRQEKLLRGKMLRTSPADSWHQPTEDSEGRVLWNWRSNYNTHHNNTPAWNEPSSSNATTVPVTEDTVVPNVETVEEKSEYDILDILNRDCLMLVFSYVPLRDLIRSERVSHRWHNAVQDYLQGMRVLKTSWWEHGSVTLTTAVLRHVLQRVGGSLTRLHIDHHWSALNDRTAHIVGKYCPSLEEFKVVRMYTVNWNPVIYGCKKLKSLVFNSCSKVTDKTLLPIVTNETSIEKLTITNNNNVTGTFLNVTKESKLNFLAFCNCYSLQASELTRSIDSLTNLTTLKLDGCSPNVYKIAPGLMKQLPKLEQLSLSSYNTPVDPSWLEVLDEFCEAISKLTELKAFNVSRNVYITNRVLKQVAQSCHKLESLNVSSCNSLSTSNVLGVGDEGITAVCKSCRQLERLDVSYLGLLTDAGLTAAANCPRLRCLVSRGNGNLSFEPFVKCMQACHQLQEIDVCGCENVTSEIASEACAVLEAHPRKMTLWLAGTDAASEPEILATHKLLDANVDDDHSNAQLRPDFLEYAMDDSSGEDYEFYEDMDEYLGSDDDLDFDDDDIYEISQGLYQIGFGLYGDMNLIDLI